MPSASPFGCQATSRPPPSGGTFSPPATSTLRKKSLASSRRNHLRLRIPSPCSTAPTTTQLHSLRLRPVYATANPANRPTGRSLDSPPPAP